MRSSSGGWVMNRRFRPWPILPLMPNAAIWSGSGAAWPRRRRSSAAIMVSRPASVRAAGVGAELAMPREPHHDHAGENAEHQLRDDHGDEERRAVAALGLEHDAIDDVADDARQEDDEGVHHALDQRQRHHVAVGDVADLVAEHGFGFAAATCRAAARC